MKHLKDNYNYSIRLRCLVCGRDDCFESQEDTSYIKCTNCGKEYFGGRDELIEYNNEQIQESIDQKKKEITSDVKTEIHDMIKKAFAGCKNIKIK